MRTAKIERKTTETQIAVEVNLDGTGTYEISTGIGFLDHMVEQLSRHSLIDINMSVQGDLHIDQHHTVEDSAIALGEALSQALGAREGITRYGAAETPMDEACTRVAIDLSNRPYLVWKVEMTQKRMGEMDSELFKEWFYAMAQSLGATLHVECLYGANNHHIIEASYKGLARSLRQAVEIDPRKEGAVPSTKGTLGGTL